MKLWTFVPISSPPHDLQRQGKAARPLVVAGQEGGESPGNELERLNPGCAQGEPPYLVSKSGY